MLNFIRLHSSLGENVFLVCSNPHPLTSLSWLLPFAIQTSSAGQVSHTITLVVSSLSSPSASFIWNSSVLKYSILKQWQYFYWPFPSLPYVVISLQTLKYQQNRQEITTYSAFKQVKMLEFLQSSGFSFGDYLSYAFHLGLVRRAGRGFPHF